MKVFAGLFFGLLFSISLSAQWSTSGSNIYYTGGKIGLRTSTMPWNVTVKGGVKFLNENNSSKTLELAHGGSNAFINVTGGGRFDFRVAGGNIISMTEGGKVGVGTINPQSELSVNGKIESEEVQVKQDVADYVFYDNYNVMSLEDLEEYILDNGHLPNIQTQKDVDENNGKVRLGELTISLMEKVEELTLHIIELNKKIIELESK